MSLCSRQGGTFLIDFHRYSLVHGKTPVVGCHMPEKTLARSYTMHLIQGPGGPPFPLFGENVMSNLMVALAPFKKIPTISLKGWREMKGWSAI